MDEKENLLTVLATVEHIVYQNSENGYTVCELNVDDCELLTAVGIMPYICEGETISAMGNYTVHPSFGRQFKVEYFEKKLPTTSTAILKYLSARSIKGIGPKTANAIVEKYGEDSLDVIENHPEWLADLPGISQRKAREISDDFKEQFGVRSVMSFFKDFIGPAMALRVYKRFGIAAIDFVKEDPYILCEEGLSIPFEKADKIAASYHIPKNANCRVAAGIKYVLKHNAYQNGHVYVPEEKLIQTVQKFISVSREQIEDVAEDLFRSGDIKLSVIGHERRIYLEKLFSAEKYIAQKLDMIDGGVVAIDKKDIDILIDKIENEECITYAKMQRAAIEKSLTSGIMILTGGPGTGKTTVIRAMIKIFSSLGFSTVLAAPTGRAAKRMEETTGVEAKTIHRLLETTYGDDGFSTFRRCEDSPLDEDVVILDESSMIDTLLFDAFLKAVKKGTRVIMIGDADQLPSVGPGSVLRDLIESDRFSTIKLSEIFRQASQSLIVTNAHKINEGIAPDLSAKDKDFFFLPRESPVLSAQTVVDLCKNRLPKRYGKEVIDEIQVITPSKKSEAGTEILNVSLQAALNPPDASKREKNAHGIIFREGDKVMQVRNNYDIMWKKEDGEEGVGIFNGDIGVVVSIDNANETMNINFDGKAIEYDYALLEDLEHAYAVTVHKSQGSEYPVVIIPIYPYTQKLLTRNLIYTAVTRARDMAILVGDEETLMCMIANNTKTKRYTGLCDLLKCYDDAGL